MPCRNCIFALRTGLLYLGVPKTLSFIYECNLTEAVTLPLEDENKGFLTKECIPMLLEYMEKMDAVAIGPGLSTKEDVKMLCSVLLKTARCPW